MSIKLESSADLAKEKNNQILQAQQVVKLLEAGVPSSEALDLTQVSPEVAATLHFQNEIQRLLEIRYAQTHQLNDLITNKLIELGFNPGVKAGDQIKALKLLTEKREVEWNPQEAPVDKDLVFLQKAESVLSDALQAIPNYRPRGEIIDGDFE